MDEVKENLNMVSNRIETLLFLPIPWFILDLVLSEPLICSFSIITFFQAEIGSISSDIKILQEKSMDMGLKLKNRKVVELSFDILCCYYVVVKFNVLRKCAFATYLRS